MRLLFIADVVGRPGRKAVADYLGNPERASRHDVVVANGENAAGGKGLTRETARELFNEGVHVLTGGNHIWRQREFEEIADDPRVLRPANYPVEAEAPGHGWTVHTTMSGERLGVVSLMGRTFMNHHEDPFLWAERAVEALGAEGARSIVMDFHAEATSEKVAMFRLLDGRVSAVIGTHTHVQTADEQISEQGTAYLTDAGMTGPRESVLGVKSEIALRQLRSELPVRHELAGGPAHLSGVAIEIDDETGRARTIRRVLDPPYARERP